MLHGVPPSISGRHCPDGGELIFDCVIVYFQLKVALAGKITKLASSLQSLSASSADMAPAGAALAFIGREV
jgi:hypothetical protein